MHECGPASHVLARLRAEGRRGLALLESADHRVDGSARTILAARGLVRVELRDQRVSYEPLVDEAAALADHLERVTPPLYGPRDLVTDDERLREPSVLDAIRCAATVLADRQPAHLAPGLFGAFGYEIVDHFESLPARRADMLDEPDATFVLAGDLLTWDSGTSKVTVTTRGLPWESARDLRERHNAHVALVQDRREAPTAETRDVAPAAAETDLSDEAFCERVEHMREHIGRGDIFQAVISRAMRVVSSADTLAVYEQLRRRNPSPYMFHLDTGDGVLLGSSPETFLKVTDGDVEIRPIAGTAPRGFRDGELDDDLDSRLALELLFDQKEQAEHAMLLDLARNDIARVSLPGTTRVVEQFAIEKYSHCQHLVSRVRGRLRDGLDALHAYRAAANMGTLTGAPKPRAMALIREAEPSARGFYGGAAGYLLADGSFDSCIVIRSLRYKWDAYHTRAGAGIVWDSRPERELRETEQKSLACRVAIAAAQEQAR